jgi:hypothetical protein
MKCMVCNYVDTREELNDCYIQPEYNIEKYGKFKKIDIVISIQNELADNKLYNFKFGIKYITLYICPKCGTLKYENKKYANKHY